MGRLPLKEALPLRSGGHHLYYAKGKQVSLARIHLPHPESDGSRHTLGVGVESQMGKIAHCQSLAFNEHGQLSQAIPQSHTERMLHELTPIVRIAARPVWATRPEIENNSDHPHPPYLQKEIPAKIE